MEETNKIYQDPLSYLGATAEKYGVSLAAILGPSRSPRLVGIRKIIIKELSSWHPPFSDEDIAKLLGKNRLTIRRLRLMK